MASAHELNTGVLDFAARLMAGETVRDAAGSTWQYGYRTVREPGTATEKKPDILVQSGNVAVRQNKHGDIRVLPDHEKLPQEIIASIHGPKIAGQFKNVHFDKPQVIDYSTLKPAHDKPLVRATPSKRVKVADITDHAALLRHTDGRLLAHTLKNLGVKKDDLHVGETVNLARGRVVKDMPEIKREQTVKRGNRRGQGIGF